MPLASDLGVTDVLATVMDVYLMDVVIRRDEASFLCPSHSDVHPSADVNLDTGLWSCFSCGAKGDLAGLGSVVLKLPREDILELLKPNSPNAKLAVVKRKLERSRQKPTISHRRRQNALLPRQGSYEAGPMSYMRHRGFTRHTLRRWGCRFVATETLTKDDGATFQIKDSIGIPVRNAERRLQAWAYRKTDTSLSWQPKYLYTPGFDLSSNWFGLHLHANKRVIYIVEGPMDAMWLDQHGIPALALMGSNHRNPRKFALLNRYEKVILVPDYDSGGVFMAHRVGLLLRGRIPVLVARWPKAVVARTEKEQPDPQDIRRPEDLKLVVSRTIPWQTWCLRQGLPTREENTRR